MKRVFWAAILIISAQSNHAAPPVSKAELADSRSPKQEPKDWHLIGNFGTLPGTHFLGTTDKQALELKVNAERVLRLEPNERGNANILGGSPLNQIGTGSHASVITGGGGWVPCKEADEEDCTDDDALPFYSRPQVINGSFSFIGGGAGNRINGLFGVIVGGQDNSIQFDRPEQGYSSVNCAILGGRDNSMTNSYMSSILGGVENRLGGYSDVFGSVIAGGMGNHIFYGNAVAISGGYNNYIFGQSSTIGGGYGNSIDAIGGGGGFSTIPGGLQNSVRGDYCFAAGSLAKAEHSGVFIWSDYTAAGPFYSVRANEFAARATGGFRFMTGSATGAELPPGGGSWASLCDRNSKENFRMVNAREILDKVAALPLQTWNYKSQNAEVRHLGPTAQDFNAAFGLGEDARHITSVDADGVSLAAIQALHQMMAEKDAEIQQLKQLLADVQKQLSRITETLK